MGMASKKRERENDIYNTDGKISSKTYYSKEPFNDITVLEISKKVVRAVDL